MGSTVSGQEDADFETSPEGATTDASMEPELLTEVVPVPVEVEVAVPA
jgi:hypothetical protein